ncbi:unnamed protein product, partial [Mesorhabditis spiculigera]
MAAPPDEIPDVRKVVKSTRQHLQLLETTCSSGVTLVTELVSKVNSADEMLRPLMENDVLALEERQVTLAARKEQLEAARARAAGDLTSTEEVEAFNPPQDTEPNGIFGCFGVFFVAIISSIYYVFRGFSARDQIHYKDTFQV